MAAHAQSNVFWISYEPAEHERFADVIDLLDKVVPGKPGLWAGEVLRNGRRAVDAILCLATRLRVSHVCGQTKWKRKGAKGRVGDAKWPAAREPACSFLTKWADAMSRQCRSERTGSRDQVFHVLDRYHEKERHRMKALRVSRKKRSEEERRLEKRVEDLPPPVSAGLVGTPQDEVSGLFCIPHDFTDVDFGLLAEGPCSSASVPSLSVGLALADSGMAPCDDFPWNLDLSGDWSKDMDFNMGVDFDADLDWNTVMPVYECDV
ncbi:hypothetical protein HIM_10570 [Hirsutella minnesotensis 3608]|uniref:Uncharacterized protein n=1 Tax=Hirsutella minnesotensis 3608 TaxID=1043627 RepID=A0A0F7ZX37_9HYPO|nr:hypothetical protein HIM_10570 [Hirsutella minnesotensis 3608]